MVKPLRRFAVFLVAILVTGVIASFFSTQFVLAALRDVGAAIPLGDNLRMVVADLGVLKALLPLAGTALLVGFLVAGLCARFIGNRTAWFVVAGFAAMITLLLIIKSTLGVMPLSGARSIAGLVFQGISGGIGGFLFARATEARPAAEISNA